MKTTYDYGRRADASSISFEEVTVDMAEAGAAAAKVLIEGPSWQAGEANRLAELAARVWGAMRAEQLRDPHEPY